MRSVGTVLAGLVVFTLGLVAMQIASGPVDGFSTPGMVLWVAWEGVAMAAAGFVVASFVRRAPVAHAAVMSALQVAMTLAAMLAVRDGSSPLWFWLAGMAVMVPGACAGAALRARMGGSTALPAIR